MMACKALLSSTTACQLARAGICFKHQQHIRGVRLRFENDTLVGRLDHEKYPASTVNSVYIKQAELAAATQCGRCAQVC
jgi:hypothetical protein